MAVTRAEKEQELQDLTAAFKAASMASLMVLSACGMAISFCHTHLFKALADDAFDVTED